MMGNHHPIIPFILLTGILVWNTSCLDKSHKTDHKETVKILNEIQVYPNVNCSQKHPVILTNWSQNSVPLKTYLESDRSANQGECTWTRLLLINPAPVSQTKVFYFPKGWQELEFYIEQSDGSYFKKNAGVKYRQEVIYTTTPPNDSVTIYVKYPEPSNAYYASLRVRELTEENYLKFQQRTYIKYFFLGILLFPLLFFLVQLLIQKDKLSLYYFLFLLGSAAYLLTMVETVPYFQLSPRIVNTLVTVQRLFVLSTLILMIGLVKYFHEFLHMNSWSRNLVKAGNVLLGIFAAIGSIPMVVPALFRPENYENYLQYFRIWALILVVYVLILLIRGLVLRVKFSRILFLAFSPFIFSVLWYVVSFLILRQFSANSLVSLVLIMAFILTLLLFGVILGVRNNAIKSEKIRLEQETRRLNELDHFKSRFYTNITHEFRTPLTVIRGMVSQIPDHEEIKSIVRNNSDRLLNMVNELLELSQLETNTLSIDWVNGDIVPYFKYLTESCHSLATEKNIQLSFETDDHCIILDYDEDKIQHILINLITNAIKFTPANGSVRVIVAKTMENSSPYLVLRVKDTGCGISQNDIPHIFDRFFQADSSKNETGTGIGLALVHEIVKLLDGRINVDSVPNEGSEFSVYLPILHESQNIPDPNKLEGFHLKEDGPTSESYSLQMDNSDPEHRPLLLIIEDNKDVTRYIISCLENDYMIQMAENGKIGVEMAIESIPDVILSDVMMPEMDGLEVCERLKSDQRTSHIPIILLTAKSAREDKLEGLSKGADAYLSKPFDKEELLIRLNHLTAQSKILKQRLESFSEEEKSLNEMERREAKFLKDLDQVIESQMSDEQFNTQHLCRSIGMSRTQLYRKLNALIDQSPASYIRTFRLKQARSLLIMTDEPIGQIATSVGFKDFSHFSRSFFKEFNEKPSGIRKDQLES